MMCEIGIYETTTITSISCFFSYLYLQCCTSRFILLLSWCYYFGMSELFNKNRTTFNGYKHTGIFILYGILWISTLSFINIIPSIENIIQSYNYDISEYVPHVEAGLVFMLMVSTVLLKNNLALFMHNILLNKSNLCKIFWIGITPHYLFQSRKKRDQCNYVFRWSLGFYETMLHVIYGSFVSNYITFKYFSIDEGIEGVNIVNKLLISGIVIFTTLFGYHQSFNMMVLVITNKNLAWYYNLLLVLSIQIISSIGQAILGYKTNVINRVMTSPVDREMTNNVLNEFDTVTPYKAIKMGYVLNSLGDTVYSIVWGNLIKMKKHNWFVLIWSSALKESMMMVTTISYAFTHSAGTGDNQNIKYIIKIFATVYLITNHIISMILLRRYMTNTDITNSRNVFHPSKIRKLSIQILRIVVFFSIITVSVLYFTNVFPSKSDFFVYLVNGINILIVLLFILRII